MQLWEADAIFVSPLVTASLSPQKDLDFSPVTPSQQGLRAFSPVWEDSHPRRAERSDRAAQACGSAAPAITGGRH